MSTLLVLDALIGGDQHSYGIMLRTAIRTGAVTRILHRLEDLGWATSEWEIDEYAVGRRGRRRLYTLTTSGHDAATRLIDDRMPRMFR